jgi:hypothetical protein
MKRKRKEAAARQGVFVDAMPRRSDVANLEQRLLVENPKELALAKKILPAADIEARSFVSSSILLLIIITCYETDM